MEASALNYAGGVGLGRSPLLRLQSDERLITLVRRGNAAAFETLVSRYHSRLLAFCRHMLGSHEDAEDVLQEAFAAAYHAILADDRPINARPWLYRIARNRSLNHLRRTQAVGVDSMDVHFSDHGATTADKVHSREDFRALVADIGALPETQRTALVLREMEALSYEQIAEAMETTVPSVKSLLVRARVSLAEAAESRLLSCEEVRMELGQIAEGLLHRPTPPVRRHLKTCRRCDEFQGQLKKTNKALAALLPIGPFVLLRKVVLAHLGHSAGSGATAAGSSMGATGAGTATGGTAALGSGAAAAGSAVAASSSAGGVLSAGVGALASKAAAGLAAAALMTAGAVEASHSNRTHHNGESVATQAAVLAPVTGGVAAGASAESLLAGTPAPQHNGRSRLRRSALARGKGPGATRTADSAHAPAAAGAPSTATTTGAQGRTATTPIDTVLPPSTTLPTSTVPVGNDATPSVTTTINPTDGTPTTTDTTPVAPITVTSTTPTSTTPTSTTPTSTTPTSTTPTSTTPTSTTPVSPTPSSTDPTASPPPASTGNGTQPPVPPPLA